MKTIKENRLFKRLYRKGEKFVDKQLVLYCLKTADDTMVGITVRKKLGKATVRNKIKRRIKESIRKYERDFKSDYIIVVVARTAAVYSDFSQIDLCLCRLLEKAGII